MYSQLDKQTFPSLSFPSIMTENSPDNVQSTELQATYAGAKRKIAALEQQLQNLKEAGAKRKL
jgi:hypothetical protein